MRRSWTRDKCSERIQEVPTKYMGSRVTSTGIYQPPRPVQCNAARCAKECIKRSFIWRRRDNRRCNFSTCSFHRDVHPRSKASHQSWAKCNLQVCLDIRPRFLVKCAVKSNQRVLITSFYFPIVQREAYCEDIKFLESIKNPVLIARQHCNLSWL